jgi:ABC-2 type transport system permease protein
MIRPALTIAWRDLRATFLSPFGVGCTAAFVALSGVLLVLDLRPGQARLDNWFAPLFLVLGALASLLTMRSFADEERTGSLELLLTAPVTRWQVVAGKLLGVAGVLAAVTVASAVCPWLVTSMGHPDAGPIITGYVGMVLVGLAFIAVGLAVSTATGNPLVAAAGSMAILVTLWFGGFVAGGLTGRPHLLLLYLSPSSHVTGFLRGTLSLADIVYFVSFTVLGLTIAGSVLRWRR